jgi:shikimate dehydrogenase
MNAILRRFGVIGDPVEHSLSPRMHAAGFAALGIEAEYVAVRVPATEGASVEAAMRELAATGGGNVTLPHKGRAALALDEMTDVVRETGACNCFWETVEGNLAGDNTDVTGIVEVLDGMLVGREPADVLILGAGGAAAAAAVAAARLGAPAVRIANRTPARAARLAARMRKRGVEAQAEPWPAAGTCDVVINATSLGLAEADPPPASFDRVTARLALDLVYVAASLDGGGEPGTRWTRAAAARGIAASDGVEVLIRQGAACYPHWFGVQVPLEALRRGIVAGEV